MELVKAVVRPDEFSAMVRFKLFKKLPPISQDPNVAFCYQILIDVSRSFAMVIQELPEELRDAVCVFYLVLRALDTVEDDTKYPLDLKLPLLREFYTKLEEPGYTLQGCGEKHYKVLLEQYDKVIAVYQSLNPKYRAVISDITKRMGAGMAEFIDKKGVTSIEDWDLYCHYVAGLVGYGLSDLFASSGLEDERFFKEHKLSNSMGLFLQKVNIIRDYREDIEEDRIFWPSHVYNLYAERIEDFKEEKNIPKGVQCLNHLITDALRHALDALEYMSLLRDPQIFNFCAIPQVMAIATLALCYNNPNVFRRVVKIRKGLTAKLIMNVKNIDDVRNVFYKFACDIERRIPADDPNAEATREIINKIKSAARPNAKTCSSCPMTTRNIVGFFAASAVAGAAGYLIYKNREIIGNHVKAVFPSCSSNNKN
eukprot:GEZU01020462.1.p1 GENE.GEZU01020462.1~~GEZU01020462.1.p1  ORF type:complete len:425 (+),score=189.52 GEZU01020462.1:558-1832(+)